MNEEKRLEIPRGFLFAAGEAGLRTHSSGSDLGLVYSTVPARVAALFTTNRVKAAPVLASQQHLRASQHRARAIVVNAGNANSATGKQGMDAARQCAKRVAELLGIPEEQVLVASTGVIGLPLDPGQITSQLPALARRLHPEGCGSVAEAILTTDTRPKVALRSLKLTGKRITILGMAKGAGMIYPRLAGLATMLGFFFTDAAVEPRFLQAAARLMCDLSFNRISVDGDTSTNDTVFVLANGMAGNRTIRAKSAEGEKFLRALTEVAQELALELVRDGEGAGKMAEIRVEKAASEKQAEAIARSIGLSPLVKTALAGADPNWGRILSAVGNAGVELDPDRVDIYLNRILVCKKGMAARYDEAALQRQLEGREVLIRVVLHQGTASTRFWTCDFTEEYIRINASYRT